MYHGRKYSSLGEAREAKKSQSREYMRRRRAAGTLWPSNVHLIGPRPVPPVEVAAERDRVAAARVSLTAELMGDPSPGRSALDRKRAGE